MVPLYPDKSRLVNLNQRGSLIMEKWLMRGISNIVEMKEIRLYHSLQGLMIILFFFSVIKTYGQEIKEGLTAGLAGEVHD